MITYIIFVDYLTTLMTRKEFKARTQQIIFLFIVISAICLSCSNPESEVVWVKKFLSLGSSSSPSCIDLNGDGILDCVIGAGLNEFDHTDSSVLAINGLNGEVLWAVGAKDQIIGSPVFIDITQDGNPDVFIGGRGAEFFAIDGNKGEVIWKYKTQDESYTPKGLMRFNFYTPQKVKDQSGDNIPDLLVANGGNFSADPVSGNNRYPGVLAIIDSQNGKIIAADTMPDGAETYMSPVVFQKNNTTNIVYGSGGETFGGSLFLTSLDNLMNNDISESIILDQKDGHGFIAPPTLVDVNNDHQLDIISNWHGGEVAAIDGSDHKVLWRYLLPDTEIYASPTPGYANEDDIPDLFIQFTEGKWPNYSKAHQKVLDGGTGEIIYETSQGCGSFSTALSIDSDNDGRSEFIYSVNDFDCEGYYLGSTKFSLMRIDMSNNMKTEFLGPIKAKNTFSTPWIGDIDGDEKLDMILCIQYNYNDVFGYHGMNIYRLKLNWRETEKRSWLQYLGNDQNGVY